MQTMHYSAVASTCPVIISTSRNISFTALSCTYCKQIENCSLFEISCTHFIYNRQIIFSLFYFSQDLHVNLLSYNVKQLILYWFGSAFSILRCILKMFIKIRISSCSEPDKFNKITFWIQPLRAESLLDHHNVHYTYVTLPNYRLIIPSLAMCHAHKWAAYLSCDVAQAFQHGISALLSGRQVTGY